MRRVAVVGQVVRAMGTRSEMLDPLQPAWNKAWSGWSKWSKHFQRLVNKKTDCLIFKHPLYALAVANVRKNPDHLDHPDHPFRIRLPPSAYA